MKELLDEMAYRGSRGFSSKLNNVEEKQDETIAKKGLCLDLSCQSLKSVPSADIVEPIHLQDNLLERLPDGFFHNFPSLRHLDLRQNKLQEIPRSIAGHNSLEVLLIQNNQLPSLPCELGQVPRLRKLQFSGNPLTWPPQEVLAQGLGAILSFLRGAFMDQLSRGNQNVIPKADSYECTKDMMVESSQLFSLKQVLKKSVSLDKSQPASITSQRKSLSSSNLLNSLKGRNSESQTGGQITSKTTRVRLSKGGPVEVKHQGRSKSKEFKSPSLLPHISPGHAQAVMNGQYYPLGYKKHSHISTTKIYKTLLQKIWINQLKCVLQSQDDALQRQKTSEALYQWRQKAKALQRSGSVPNWSGLEMPYDFDPHNLKMVTRATWQQFQNESLEKRGHSKPNTVSCVQAMGLQEKINQILQSFDEMKSSKSSDFSGSHDTDTSTRCKLLAEEMKRISNLHKAVQALRLSA